MQFVTVRTSQRWAEVLLLSESRVIINNLELLKLALNTNQSINELVCDIAWLYVTNHLCHGSRS